MSFVKKINIFKKILNYSGLLMRYNTLKIEYKALIETTKTNVFKKLMDDSEKESEIERLKKENKNLREKIKELKNAK